MGWEIGFDSNWNRDIGYGVPSICDHPDCDIKIDRGLSYVCGSEPYGGNDGCGLYFCEEHLLFTKCERCEDGKQPFEAKKDVQEWMLHKLEHESWGDWRKENPDIVKEMLINLNEH